MVKNNLIQSFVFLGMICVLTVSGWGSLGFAQEVEVDSILFEENSRVNPYSNIQGEERKSSDSDAEEGVPPTVYQDALGVGYHKNVQEKFNTSLGQEISSISLKKGLS